MKRTGKLFLHFHRRELKLSTRAIAKKLQCSRDTVETWIHRYQKTEDVQDEEGRSRKRKTSEREDLDIVAIAKKNRTKTLAEISISMDKQGTTISKTTIGRRLNEQGLYKLQLLKKSLISDTHRDNTVGWNRLKRIRRLISQRLYLQMRQLSLNSVNLRKSGDIKVKKSKYLQ